MHTQAFLIRLTFMICLNWWLPIEVTSQQVFVSSRNGHMVRLYDFHSGNFIEEFVPAGSGGLSFPQEVVWHPQGFLLVTGRGNVAIKKYDGVTGEYLGNFTSGYNLDNPTKTSIGSDGKLYVSQWGLTKNKVVRFNLDDGVFVDEFTSIGIPSGAGHAWDTHGNFYVAQYGNGIDGRVMKFDDAGTFVSTFISSGQLQGPINLWFDDTGHLYVADWTKGDVLQFDASTGDFQYNLVSGLQNVEGFDFDDAGRLYLCDWTANAVYRYDFESQALSLFISDAALAAPNSILIRDNTSPSKAVPAEDLSFTISPNPATGAFQIAYTLKKTARVKMEIWNMKGQLVSSLADTIDHPGNHVLTCTEEMISPAITHGTYILRLQAGTQTASLQLVLN